MFSFYISLMSSRFFQSTDLDGLREGLEEDKAITRR